MSDQTGNEQKQGDLAQEILNRIVTDADFRQELLNNPVETLAKAGFTGGDDVSGYMFKGLDLRTLDARAYGSHPHGVEPITTGINCTPPPPPPGTTAMNCGGGGGITDPPPSSTPKPKKMPNAL